MSDIDESQVLPEVPEQNAPVTPTADEPKELSTEEELAQLRAEEEPEKPVEGEQPADPEAPKEPDAPAEDPKEPEAPKEPSQDEEAERKRHNAEMAQKRIEERDAQRRQVEQTLDQAYKPQPVDELTQSYMDQGYDQFQAEMLARDEVRNQREQITEARTQVAELNMQVETEAIQVMHEMPVFNPSSPEYDKDFADKASKLYVKASNAEVDPNTGLIVRTNITPYQFYKDLNDMRNSGVSQARIAAQKAAEQQLAAVAPQSSSAPVVNESPEDKQAQGMEAALSNVR